MGDVEPQDSGLASGIVNTAFMVGRDAQPRGLAANCDVSHGQLARASGDSDQALTGGYRAAFLVGALFAATGERARSLCSASLPAPGRNG